MMPASNPNTETHRDQQTSLVDEQDAPANAKESTIQQPMICDIFPSLIHPTPADTHNARRKRRYSLLPSASLRTKNTIYETPSGMYKMWDGKNLRPICQDCHKYQSNHPDEKNNIRRLCAMCADKKGTKIVKTRAATVQWARKRRLPIQTRRGRPTEYCAAHVPVIST